MIYKILTKEEWQQTEKDGFFKGSVLDQADGYIHCSTAEQVAKTKEKFFNGQGDLILLSINEDLIKEHVKWEASPRSGQIYPHIYANLPVSCVIKAEELKD